MMAGTNGDALHIERLGNIVGMNAFHRERNDAPFSLGLGSQDS